MLYEVITPGGRRRCRSRADRARCKPGAASPMRNPQRARRRIPRLAHRPAAPGVEPEGASRPSGSWASPKGREVSLHSRRGLLFPTVPDVARRPDFPAVRVLPPRNGRAGSAGRHRPAARITSYNVCYTKLLRPPPTVASALKTYGRYT